MALYSPKPPWHHERAARKCWSWKPGCGTEEESKTVNPLSLPGRNLRQLTGTLHQLSWKNTNKQPVTCRTSQLKVPCMSILVTSFAEVTCIRKPLIRCYTLRTLLKRAEVGSLWSVLIEQFLYVNCFHKIYPIFSPTSCAIESPKLELTCTAVCL